MNTKGLGFIGTTILIVGVVALFFIYKTGLIEAFINFVKGFTMRIT